jgi:uncharacterized protein (DUF4213/DUF364 family)
LAATQANNGVLGVDDIRASGRLHEMTAGNLAGYLRSERPLEVSVGMAALNSYLTPDPRDTIDLNVRELIVERGRGKNVVMVGHFAFTDIIRQAVGRLWVLELNPQPGDYPADLAPELLPQADVIGITAMTLLNHTFEGLARLFPPKALVVMLGPTTPFSPVLFDYGVGVVAGLQVGEPHHLMRQISQCAPLHKPVGTKRLAMARDRTVGRVH